MKHDRLFKIIVPLGVIVLTLISLEAVGRIVVANRPAKSRKEFRLQQPPPYQNASYWSPEFIRKEQRLKYDNADGTRVTPRDVAGPHINVVQGRRVTTDAPANPQATCYVFGGSTVICAEVPDQYTLPSNIQRGLNAVAPGKYQVVNMGVSSQQTYQQLQRLPDIAAGLQAGDIVIWYDGVNDVLQGVFYGRIQSTMAQRSAETPAVTRWLIKGAEYSDFLAVFADPVSHKAPPQVVDLNLRQSLVEATGRQYVRNIRQAHDIVTAKGGRFYHFLQPTAFETARPSRYESNLLSNYFLVPRGTAECFRSAYPKLREVTAALDYSTDISRCLSDRADGAEYYLDFCHVNHDANARIAAAIMATLHHD